MFNIAGILVVNMPNRDERWQTFLKYADNWNWAFGCVPERLEAVVGIDLQGYDEGPWFTKRLSEKRRRSWGGKAGCILSHRKAIATARKRGWDNVLIVEDDAYLTRESAEAWRTSLSRNAASMSPCWAGLYLCTTTIFPPNRLIAEAQGYRLVETTGALGTVAYMVNSSAFGPLLQMLPTEQTIWPWVAAHKTIDRWFSRTLFGIGPVYSFAPSLVGHHSVGMSDISMTAEDDCHLDFSLGDITLERNSPAFTRKKTARLLMCRAAKTVAKFRRAVKHLRGL